MLVITTGFLFFKESGLWKLSNSRAGASLSYRKLDGLYSPFHIFGVVFRQFSWVAFSGVLSIEHIFL